MEEMHFNMGIRREGRIKYIIISVIPSLLIIYLVPYLLTYVGISEEKSNQPCVIAAFIVLLVMYYFLFFSRNHTYTFHGRHINVLEWNGNERTVSMDDVASVKKNIMGEVILRDKSGKKLLVVEGYMTNFNIFREYLQRGGYKI